MNTFPICSRSWCLAFLFLIFSFSLSAQCDFRAGDLAFTGYNSYDDDANGAGQDDRFSFVLLKDAPAGLEIFFTDLGWTGDRFQEFQNAPTDGLLKWTSPTGGLLAGTQVVITGKYNLAATKGTVASVTASQETGKVLSLGIAGDQLFAFTGTTASPTLLAGININKSGWDTSSIFPILSSSYSVQPTSLSDGQNLSVSNPEGHAYNAIFSYPTPNLGGTTASLLYFLNNPGFWAKDATRFPSPVPVNFQLPAKTSFTITPATITNNPENLLACPATPASFSTEAENECLITWQSSPDGITYTDLSNGGVYSGVNTTQLRISNVDGLDQYYFRAKAQGATIPFDYSEPALLTIVLEDLTVTAPTGTSSVTYGLAETSFSVTASQYARIYQWQVSTDGTTYTDITNGSTYTGADTPDLSIHNPVVAMDGNLYRAKVTDFCNTIEYSEALELQVAPYELEISLTGSISKVYDETTAAALELSNYSLAAALGDDVVALDAFNSGNFDSENVGAEKLVSVTGLSLTGADAPNYILKNSSLSANIGSITAAPISVVLTGSVEKEYDGTSTASLAIGNYDISGILGDDVVALSGFESGSFDSGLVGTGKTVSISGLSLTGADVANYELKTPSLSAAIGTISIKTLNVSLTGTVVKDYDGNTSAVLTDANYLLPGIVTGDEVELSGHLTGTFDTAAAGTGKTISVSGLSLTGADAGNYELSQTSLSAPIGTIIDNDPPVASNVSVSGTPVIGETLTGSYEYSDKEEDPETGSKFSWYRSDDAAGTGKSLISGAETTSYLLTSADIGKYISFGVEPYDNIHYGTFTESSPVGPVNDLTLVTSITRVDASPSNSTQVSFEVSFDQSVSGVDAGDFSLTVTGITTGNISSVSGSGSSYVVSVSGISGDGSLRLDFTAPEGIFPAAQQSFTAGESYSFDFTAPNVIAKDITVELEADGTASIVASALDNGSTDNLTAAADLEFSVDLSAFDCEDTAAPVAVSLTVKDALGNSATASVQVTVVDRLGPTVLVKPLTVELGSDGSVSFAPEDLDNGSSDNCGIASMSLDITSFSCGDVGTQTVQLTVTDVNGNSTTVPASVIVEDNLAPVVVTKNIGLPLGTDGTASLTAADIDNGTSSNCDLESLSLDITAFDCSNVGPNTVTLTATDKNGNSASQTAVVTVVDNLDPTVATQNITVQLGADGTVSITPEAVDAGSSDNCGIASLTLDTSSFTCANVGENSVTLTVTDVNGNSASETAKVIVEDKAAPTVAVKNITVQLGLDGTVSITPEEVDAGSSDNCEIASITLDITTFNCSKVGPNPVVLTVTDIHGNSASATATVTVEDNLAPTVVVKDITVQLEADGTASITPADVDNGTTANCDLASLTLDTTAFDCSNVGPNTVTLTATDTNGNTAFATAVVTVADSVKPTVVTKEITVQLGADGTVAINAAEVDAGSSDNCTIASMTLDTDSFTCDNVGENTVTLTVTDVNGNTASETAKVIVEDKAAPTVAVKNITVQIGLDGTVSISPEEVDAGSSDNCEIASMTLDITSFDCSEVGRNPVVLTVTDIHGNSASANATVTVEDNIAPKVVVKDITVQLEADGTVSITPVDVDNGTTTNCDVASLSLDITSFDCSNVGPNTVTLTATDKNGNSAFATAIVTVVDSVKPTVVTKEITVQLGADGTVAITAAEVDAGSSDNCTIASMTLDTDSFTCDNVGENTVTLTVTDVNGNSATETAKVIVEDKAAPVAAVKNITVQLGLDGTVSISPEEVNAGSSDNCGIASMTLDVTSFVCSEVGPNPVVLTVTDIHGNSSSATATVTVEDNIAPTVVTKDITVELGADGTVAITPADVDNGTTTNCVLASLTLDTTAFDCSNVGLNTVTLTATDTNGNTAFATAVVTVVDSVKPTVVTKEISVQLGPDGTIAITAADVDAGSSDNCGIASMSLNTDSFTCENVGENTVTLTVTDVNGNSASQTAKVIVEDKAAPIVAVKNITVQLGLDGTVSINPEEVDAGSWDNCEIASMTLDITSFDCSEVGPNSVVLTVTDIHGNSASATATVTVEDNLAPTVVVKDITVQLGADGTVSITPADVDNGTTTNCDLESLMLDITSFDCSNVGPNTVTLTAADTNGNSASKTAVVTVVDIIAPSLATRAITVQLGADGRVSIAPADVDAGSTDNCSIASMTLDTESFTCANVGENTVTLTVTDVNGNSATATASVTVEDKIAPAVVTKDITVQLGPDGTVSISPEDLDAGSSDNCEIESMTLDITSFDCAEVGTNQVVLTVTDIHGNSASATATVTVEDNIAPTVVTRDITVQLGADGTVSITAAELDGGSADNCEIASLSLDISSFSCSEVGANQVSLTVVDVNGNSASAPATVTVVDNTAPAVVTRNITVQLDSEGLASITPADLDAGSTDICGIASMSLDISSFSCAEVGENTVRLSVTDVNGNTASATAVVTVEDNIAPEVVTKNISVELGPDGTVTITPEDVDAGSADNCGIASRTLDISAFSCEDVGTQTVTLSVTDVNGNTSSATAQVTVKDASAPEVVTRDITVQLGANGTVSVSPEAVDAGSSDNCGIASRVLDITDFSCVEAGVNQVRLTVTDVNGNSASAIANVTVEDKMAPTVVTRNIRVQLNSEGTVSITPADVDAGTSDNCAIESLSLDSTAFSCEDIGTNTVTLTATDIHGNSATATATVSVEDNIAPVALAKDIRVQLNSEGKVSITPEQLNNASSDACGIASMGLDISSFDCSNIGENTVVLTIIDTNGNSSSASAVVTVEDTTAPSLVTKNIELRLDENGRAAIEASALVDSATDNCGVQSIAVDQSEVDCSEGNSVEILVTVTDVNGNTTTAPATVTIIDELAPAVIAKDIVVELDASGSVTITPEDVLEDALDNCSIASLSLDKTSFSCEETGVNFVLLTVTDASGNSATAEAIVEVINSSADNDADALPDNCDPDDDNDGIIDEEDNAPLLPNPDQTDTDNDGIGDIEDEDNDNDGIADSEDNCPLNYNPGQEDINKDGIGDVCDTVSILPSEGMTPNGDGINDTWRIINIENHPNSVVRVYNRWGNEVFRSKGYRNTWNGTFENNPVPEGSYYYQIDLDGNGDIDKDGWLYITQ